MALVETRNDGAVAVITLNRPEAMNAMSTGLRNALSDAVAATAGDPEVRVIVLTGAGDRAFSAGLDLKEVGAHGLRGNANGVPVANLIGAILDCDKPIIAAVNGVAVTGGLELALACDIIIASTRARFADTHVRVGVTPGWGLSQRLPRLIGISRAKELSLSGNFIDSMTALAWGLVNRVVEPDQLLPQALALAGDIAQCDPDLVRRYKRLIDDGFGLTFSSAMALEAERSRQDNARVTAAYVEARRADILRRGRSQ
jgi:enoyl-CoA hydratase